MQRTLANIFFSQVPFLAFLFFLLVSLIVNIFSKDLFDSSLVLFIFIYFWFNNFREEYLPYYLLFFIGLILDCIYFLPLGFTSSIFLFFCIATLIKRKFLEFNFFIINWISFGLILIFTMFAGWGMLSLYYGQLISIDALIRSVILTFSLFPFLYFLCTYINRFIR